MTAGGLDPTFGTAGLVTTAMTSSGGDAAWTVAVQSNGDIVAAGDVGGTSGSTSGMGVARYTPSGSLDPTFGSGGKAIIDQGKGWVVRSLAIESNGDILLGGTSPNGLTIVRLTPNGALDPTFGSKGISPKTPNSGGNCAWGIAVQPNGQIIAVGQTTGPTATDIYVCRFNADGTVDKTFGTKGSVETDINNHYSDAQAVALEPDGTIVVAGFAGTQATFAQQIDDFVVVRYNANGTPDQAFGNGGIVETSLAPDPQIASGTSAPGGATAVAIQSNGEIVAGGFAEPDGSTEIALVRYNTEGTLDTTFGAGGESIQPATAGIGSNRVGLGLEPDGKIVAAGETYGTPGGNLVACYNPDGSLDTGFGGTGVVTTRTPNGNLGGADALAIQPSNDDIVTAGVENNGNGSNRVFFLARYVSDSPATTAAVRASSPAATGIAVGLLAPLVFDRTDTGIGLSTVKKRSGTT